MLRIWMRCHTYVYLLAPRIYLSKLLIVIGRGRKRLVKGVQKIKIPANVNGKSFEPFDEKSKTTPTKFAFQQKRSPVPLADPGKRARSGGYEGWFGGGGGPAATFVLFRIRSLFDTGVSSLFGGILFQIQTPYQLFIEINSFNGGAFAVAELTPFYTLGLTFFKKLTF